MGSKFRRSFQCHFWCISARCRWWGSRCVEKSCKGMRHLRRQYTTLWIIWIIYCHNVGQIHSCCFDHFPKSQKKKNSYDTIGLYLLKKTYLYVHTYILDISCLTYNHFQNLWSHCMCQLFGSKKNLLCSCLYDHYMDTQSKDSVHFSNLSFHFLLD